MRSGFCHSARSDRMPAVTTRITMVRIKVAMLELMPATPSLPNSAVSAANRAEPKAKATHEGKMFIDAPCDVETLFSHRNRFKVYLDGGCSAGALAAISFWQSSRKTDWTARTGPFMTSMGRRCGKAMQGQ